MLLTWKWTLETIPLNNERLSLVKTKLPIKISTPITNSHKIIRSEFQILLGSWKKNGVINKCIASFIHIFPPDILRIMFFRLLLTIKRYYNNRWSFSLGGDASPPLSYAESPRAFWAAILIRSSLAVGGGESYQRSNPWPFYIPFLKEKDPFRLPSIDNVTPFPQKVWTPFICCKCIVFKTWTNHKTRKLYGLFYIHKTHLSAL